MDSFSLDSQGFCNLLASQSSQPLDHGSSETTGLSSQFVDDQTSKERRTWLPKEDVVLISAWLNTSKDPIVGNEQKGGTFWKRIAEYYNTSPIVVGTAPREVSQCKQRWGRINDIVCKFVGCHDLAMKEQSSGQNENDVMKAANAIFVNDHGKKFKMDHAWRELRHDPKWCSSLTEKEAGKDKRKNMTDDDGAEEVSQSRPAGVKASKAAKRKKNGKEEAMEKFQKVLEMKEKLNKQRLLDRLLAKTEPLTETELSLMNKLMEEMLGM